MRHLRILLPNIAFLTVGLVAASCTTATDPVPIASMTLEPAFDSLEVGQTYDHWVVTLKDAEGNTITGRTITWESNNPGAATVDANTGVVTATNPGETVITARAGGKQATAGIRVLVPVLGVVATPDSFDLPMTTTRSIGLQLFGPNGVALTNRLVIWSSLNPNIAVVSTSGVVTPVSLGTTTITARVATKEATVRVRVIGEPATSVRILPVQAVHVLRLSQSKQLTAECLSATGQVLTGRSIAWLSSNPLVATVTNSGLVTSVAVGTSSISASCGTASASVTVQVTPIPVSSVSITPPAATLPPGQNFQLTATARDSTGAVLSLQNRQVVWVSSNNPVVGVSPIGVISTFSVGTADITVSVDGVVSPPATITVANPLAMRAIPPWRTLAPERSAVDLRDR